MLRPREALYLGGTISHNPEHRTRWRATGEGEEGEKIDAGKKLRQRNRKKGGRREGGDGGGGERGEAYGTFSHDFDPPFSGSHRIKVYLYSSGSPVIWWSVCEHRFVVITAIIHKTALGASTCSTGYYDCYCVSYVKMYRVVFTFRVPSVVEQCTMEHDKFATGWWCFVFILSPVVDA